MRYRVLVTDKARRDLEAACAWWSENRACEQAERWYVGLAAAISLLAQNANRCPPAPESDSLPYDIRQFNYGVRRRVTHRAVFTIRDDVVLVLRIRHLAQEALSPDDL